MGDLYCKCNKCQEIYDQALLETPCPFCGDELSYKEIAGIRNYFQPNIPKLNDPRDFIYTASKNAFSKLPFNYMTEKNYLTRNNNRKYHILNVVTVCQFINDRTIMLNLSIVWDNDFKNKAYGIVQDTKDCLSYRLTNIDYTNLLIDKNRDDIQIRVFTKMVSNECYERFLRNVDEIDNSFNISDLFSLYNSINWDLLDDMREKKTYYEYAAVNYLLHIFELIHVPNIDIFDYDVRLLSFNSIIDDMNYDNSMQSSVILNADEFMDRYVKPKKLPYLENANCIDYEDVFDHFSSCLEGAVAPNAVGLNQAAQVPSAVFTKLYELGYNPKMQIYSLGENTSLCPTFEKDGMLYYIECNDNIMKGINEFESLEDMKDVLNEVYNDYDENSLFVTIEGLTSDVLSFILNNAKSDKEFLTRLIDLNNKKREEFIYNYTVQDEEDFKNSAISEFDIKEMTPQNLFKYGKTHYKLRKCQKLAGNQHGYMFIDKNEIVAGYIIVDDKVYNVPTGTRTIPTVTAIEAASDYKLKGIEIAMIDYYKKKTGNFNIKIESRNFDLTSRIEGTKEYKKVNDISLPFTLFESIIDEKPLVLNEAINATKRKQIEEKIYKTFNLLDKTGANSQKYKDLFKSMSDDKFDKYIKEFLADDKKNFYLEVLPNKNCPRIKDCKDALDYLKVPTEEYVYYRHDGHEKDPIRTRYKVPVLYINLRRLQQMLSKKNTYSLDISKRNMKTG